MMLNLQGIHFEKENMKIFITGGAGYCGSRLTRQLLDHGQSVTVYDACYFGTAGLPLDDSKLKLIKGDIRDVDLLEKSLVGHEVFIHLACISNDASFELDESLSTSINLDAFHPIVKAAKQKGIKRFIYASSSSVYGVSSAPEVTEDHELIPLTLYNKYKGMCEPILFSEATENFTCVTFRPATVCGYSPRQRLDLSVNILTNLAVNKGEITVFGGDQRRPNIHIQDYVDVVELLISAPKELIQKQIFNVGNQNATISEIALMVKNIVEKQFPEKQPIKIISTSSNDNRSYHINSDKIQGLLGFRAKRTIEDAVIELCEAFKNGMIPNSLEDDSYFNVRTLMRNNIQ
jgi:nucleoside-diphosphate-sugar epimerase